MARKKTPQKELTLEEKLAQEKERLLAPANVEDAIAFLN